MHTLFLAASAGYLLGNLFVGFPSSDVWPGLLVGAAASIGWGVLMTWRGAAAGLLFFGACFLGYSVVQSERAQWETWPATKLLASDVVVIKRQPAKLWYQPMVVRSTESPAIPDILWRAPRTLEVTPGDRLFLICELKRPENFDPHFNYALYLATQDIGYVCERAHESRLLVHDITKWRSRLDRIQTTIRERMTEALPEPAAGLLQGLFLGGDDALPQSLQDAFRRAGLSHVVAVSGYNMTLVAFAVLFMALLSGLSRPAATLCAMIGIFIFLLLIDTSAASLRAALMAWIVCLAYFLGRPAQAFGSLSMAALVMAMAHPLIVRYDVGFQLSFLATLALIAGSPWLEYLARRRHWLWKFSLVPLSTIIIELFIVPVVAFHFGTVSLLGPIANTFVLPLIPVVMLLGFLLMLVGWLLPPLLPVLTLPVWWILLFIINVAESIGRLPWNALTGWIPSTWFFIGWYLVLTLIVWYSRKLLYAYALRMDH